MKFPFQKISAVTLAVLVSIACQSQNVEQTSAPGGTDAAPALSPAETVVAFHRWYGEHAAEFAVIKLVFTPPAGSGKRIYRVDFSAANTYLQKLRSSNFLSEGYLWAKMEYFRQCDKNFLRFPQTDGPPADLDVDIVLYSQKFNPADLISGAALSDLKTEDVGPTWAAVTYRFYGARRHVNLAPKNGQWQITKILPRG